MKIRKLTEGKNRQPQCTPPNKEMTWNRPGSSVHFNSAHVVNALQYHTRSQCTLPDVTPPGYEIDKTDCCTMLAITITLIYV